MRGSADRGRLRVGIVGAGFIGEVHARAARRAGARVTVVAASTPATSEAAAARLGAERAVSDGRAAALADDVDVVQICTPNHLHEELATAALDAGKHVVCETPLAVDADGARRLLAAAARAGTVTTVPFVYRFYPMVREARARLATLAGPVRLVHGSYLQDWLSSPDDDNWRVDAARSGPSRAFADIGSHWCDLVEFVTGDRIVDVRADLVTAVPERSSAPDHAHAFSGGRPSGPRRPVDTEDVALVAFRTGGGVTGSVVISQVSAGHKNQLRYEIAGADATVVFDQEHPDSLWVGRRRGTEILARDPVALDPAAAAYVTVPPGHPQGYQDCFDAFVADTYRAIAEGGSAAIDGLPTFVDGARAVDITDAAVRSSATGQWEPVAVDHREGVPS
jgi:predicted dehydrogenase